MKMAITTVDSCSRHY